MKQNYSNHIKYYPLHHFVLLPLMSALTIMGIWKACTGESDQLVWGLFAILAFCILLLAVMVRQHYALGNQDRIVRLEFRLRYFQLFGRDAGMAESKLTFGQIAALRFAGTEEFKALLERALEKDLSPKAIKQAIQDWQGDHMRV
jgi:hypothetical protein